MSSEIYVGEVFKFFCKIFLNSGQSDQWNNFICQTDKFSKKSPNYKRSVLLDCIFLLKTMSDVFNFVNDTVQSLSVVFRTIITVSL